MIPNKNICIRQWSDFAAKKLSVNPQNTRYCYASDPGVTYAGQPDIRYDAYVVCNENGYVWTHGKLQEYASVDYVGARDAAMAVALASMSERITALEAN